jgi:hypothetical protein
VVPILVLTPYFVAKSYERSHRINLLVESLAQGTAELREMTHLLENGPEPPWTGSAAEEVATLEEPDYQGFEILQDSGIIDLRSWNPSATEETSSWLNIIRHMRVVKRPASDGKPSFRVHLLTSNPKVEVTFPQQQLSAKLRVSRDKMAGGHMSSTWELAYDFSKVPAGDVVDVTYKMLSVGNSWQSGKDLSAVHFPVRTPVAELNIWILMPAGKQYRQYSMIRYPTSKPDTVEEVKLVTEYLAEDATILAFKILSLQAGYTYELRWLYKG